MNFEQRDLSSEDYSIDNVNAWKRFGFGVLGAGGLIYGTDAVAVGLLAGAIAPTVLTPVLLGVGAALHYGAYRALKHEAEIPNTPSEARKEARLTRIGRYIGGAAMTYGGAVLIGAALASPLSIVSAGVFVGGALVAGYGLRRAGESFSVATQTAEAEPRPTTPNPAYAPAV